MSEPIDQLYDPSQDETFACPFVDLDEWRDAPILHRYVHGGFEGNNTRFSIYFPPVDMYSKRFFHFLSPVQGSEDAAQVYSGEEDKISFAVSHGAYFVESNMGGFTDDPTMIYRASAAVAQHSRVIAAQQYGDHRPFGYLYGGSGGSYKTISCVENTSGIWDGAAPFVIPTPMSMPYPFTARVHAMRILRGKFQQIVDAIAPGGSGDMFAGLNDEERVALTEVTKMGFPPAAWFAYDKIGDGALPVLTPYIGLLDPTYYTDFWVKPGYLGADPNSSVHRDHIQHRATVVQILHSNPSDTNSMGEAVGETGVDEAWQTLTSENDASEFQLMLDSAPLGELYLNGTVLIVETGDAAGQRIPVAAVHGNIVSLHSDMETTTWLGQIRKGDTVRLDNSDYVALQTYHRHQVPAPEFPAWDQFRDASGNPIYPQREVILGPILAYNGCGSVQTGRFNGKMIVIDALLDESAFPWFASWYHGKVKEALGDQLDDSFRLWYLDKTMHNDSAVTVDPLQIVSYLGALQQALLDLSDWVERGITPPSSTSYHVDDCQISVAENASDRRGIQPVIKLKANGGPKAESRVGDSVTFTAEIEAPPQAGSLVSAEWDFEGIGTYPHQAVLHFDRENRTKATLEATHVFNHPGNYFVSLRVALHRKGDRTQVFAQVRNLERVRVVILNE